MRRALASLVMLALALPLSGCVGLLTSVAPDTSLAPVPAEVDILVASTRTLSPDGTPGTGRADELSYAAYSVSIPPQRRKGRAVWPQRTADPQRAFVTLGETPYASAGAFNHAVAAETRDRETRDVMVFVHGFNASFPKNLNRVAQVDVDFATPEAPILYSWPSAETLSLYAHDIDAAAFARDGLETLLGDLDRAGIGRITLVGHSMGALVVTETLRQMSLRGKSGVFDRIRVALISPDLDVDLFVAQIERTKNLPQPFVIYSSRADWLLRNFANTLLDGRERLGNITDFAPLADLPVIVVDTTNVDDVSDSFHSAAFTSPALIDLINQVAPNDGLAGFGTRAAQGAVPGATVGHSGALTTVLLPEFQ